MSGYFVLKNNGKQFSFNLKAGNHETILVSGRYDTKAAAQNGIALVQENAAHDERYKRLMAKDNSPYFNLVTPMEILSVQARCTRAPPRATTGLTQSRRTRPMPPPARRINRQTSRIRAVDGRIRTIGREN